MEKRRQPKRKYLVRGSAAGPDGLRQAIEQLCRGLGPDEEVRFEVWKDRTALSAKGDPGA